MVDVKRVMALKWLLDWLVENSICFIVVLSIAGNNDNGGITRFTGPCYTSGVYLR